MDLEAGQPDPPMMGAAKVMTQRGPAADVLTAARLESAGGETLPMRICLGCVVALPIDGAALCLSGKELARESIAASGESAARIEQLQMTVGEGPTLEALTSGSPILVADLGSVEYSMRWPALIQGVGDIEPRALFAFPLQIGAARLGALTLSRRAPGRLPITVLAETLRVADVISLLLLGSDGRLVDDFDERWLEGPLWTRQVHQATGMLIAQLGVDAEEALVRLRAFAFAEDLSLSQAAEAVVDRRTRLGVGV